MNVYEEESTIIILIVQNSNVCLKEEIDKKVVHDSNLWYFFSFYNAILTSDRLVGNKFHLNDTMSRNKIHIKFLSLRLASTQNKHMLL